MTLTALHLVCFFPDNRNPFCKRIKFMLFGKINNNSLPKIKLRRTKLRSRSACLFLIYFFVFSIHSNCPQITFRVIHELKIDPLFGAYFWALFLRRSFVYDLWPTWNVALLYGFSAPSVSFVTTFIWGRWSPCEYADEKLCDESLRLCINNPFFRTQK